MPMTDGARLLIYGAGGHGRVVLDAALQQGHYRILGFLDDEPALHGRTFHGVEVLGGGELLQNEAHGADWIVVAVGSPRLRADIVARVELPGRRFGTVLHPSAVIGSGATIGAGSMILPMAVVHTDAVLAEHVIVNTGATVDHDARVARCVHIAPGAHIGGGAVLGEGALIGIGASIVPSIQIGKKATVGAGAVVVNDVPDGVTVAGVPARPIESREA